MLPTAVMVHQLPGRLRLRVADRRRDTAYFEQLAQQLGQCPGVVEALVRPLTGSVLILHEGRDSDVILEYARVFNLFEVAQPVAPALPAADRPGQVIRQRLRQVDRWMRHESRDQTDLRSVAFVGLLGAGIWQALRGNLLPAGATLLWYALALTRNQMPAEAELTRRRDPADSGAGETDEHRANQQ